MSEDNEAGWRVAMRVPTFITVWIVLAIKPAALGGTLDLPAARGSIPVVEPRSAQPDPGRDGTSRSQTYRNNRYGFSLTYPSVFLLDRATSPDDDGAEFWTADARAGFAVFGGVNTSRQPLRDRFVEAQSNITAQDGGRVTYTRLGEVWFVVSGVGGGRIVYQRTVIGLGGRTVATLYISYPEDEKARWDTAVTLMSRSFGFGGRARR